jgi:hypothetical protein
MPGPSEEKSVGPRATGQASSLIHKKGLNPVLLCDSIFKTDPHVWSDRAWLRIFSSDRGGLVTQAAHASYSKTEREFSLGKCLGQACTIFGKIISKGKPHFQFLFLSMWIGLGLYFVRCPGHLPHAPERVGRRVEGVSRSYTKF